MNYHTNRTIVILMWSISIAAILILILYTHLNRSQEPPLSDEGMKQANAASVDMSITPDQFKELFNSAADKVDSKLRINNLKIMPGVANDTFQVRLLETVTLIGILDDDNKLQNATIIGLSDGLGADYDTSIAIVILVLSFNPELSSNDCYQIIKDTVKTINNQTVFGQTVKNGKLYFYSRTTDGKVMFSISKVPNNK